MKNFSRQEHQIELLWVISNCRNRKTATSTVSIQVQLVSYQCQHGHKLSFQCLNWIKLLSDQCQTNGHDLISYQCQHGHNASYQCQDWNKLLSDQYQTNVHDLVSYQCQHGHKLLSDQCQTNGHNLSSYVSTRTKLLYHHNQSRVSSN